VVPRSAWIVVRRGSLDMEDCLRRGSERSPTTTRTTSTNKTTGISHDTMSLAALVMSVVSKRRSRGVGQQAARHVSDLSSDSPVRAREPRTLPTAAVIAQCAALVVRVTGARRTRDVGLDVASAESARSWWPGQSKELSMNTPNEPNSGPARDAGKRNDRDENRGDHRDIKRSEQPGNRSGEQRSADSSRSGDSSRANDPREGKRDDGRDR
jgi:hypothetical protein